MTLISANFRGVEDAIPYDAGEYTFEIVKVVAETSRKGPYLRLSLRFLEGKYVGRIAGASISFSDRSLWKAYLFLRSLGLTVVRGQFKFDTDILVGLRFKARCEQDIDPAFRRPPRLNMMSFAKVS